MVCFSSWKTKTSQDTTMMSLCLVGVRGAMLEKWKGHGQSSRQSGTGTIPKPGLSDPTSWLSPLVITEGLNNREVLSIKSLSASTPRGGQWRGTGACHSTYSRSGRCQGASRSPTAQSAGVAFHYSLKSGKGWQQKETVDAAGGRLAG